VGTFVALVLVALACVLLGRIIAGCWSIVIDVALVAVFAGLTDVWQSPGTRHGGDHRRGRRKLLATRLWHESPVVPDPDGAVFISVYAGTCATVPIQQDQHRDHRRSPLSCSLVALQHLFTLEVSPDKKYPPRIE